MLHSRARLYRRGSSVLSRCFSALSVMGCRGILSVDSSSTSSGPGVDMRSVRSGPELAPDVRLEPAIGPINAAQLIDPMPMILLDFLGRLGDRIVTVGSDCCGLCAVYHALVKLGVAAHLSFASDICPVVRRYVRKKLSVDCWFDDVMTRDSAHPGVPAVDIYSAGFPCQPFSSLGLRLGFADNRGTVLRLA